MEDRLKKNGTPPAPKQTLPLGQQQPTTTTTTGQSAAATQKHGSRPGTAKASQQAVPGALPPTPGASEGEYEFIDDPYTTSFGPDNPRFRHQNLMPRLHYNVSVLQQQHIRPQHYHQLHRPPPPSDARSVKSVRTTGSVESASADFVIVPGEDGEQDN